MFILPAFMEGFTASVMGAFIGMLFGFTLNGGNFNGGPILVATMTVGATIGLAIDLIIG